MLFWEEDRAEMDKNAIETAFNPVRIGMG